MLLIEFPLLPVPKRTIYVLFKVEKIQHETGKDTEVTCMYITN